MHFDKKTLRNIFLIVSACIILYWILHETERVKEVLKIFGGIVSPFATGAALAFVANVPMRAIEGYLNKIEKPSFRRLIALVLTAIVILLVLSIVFWLLIPQVVQTVQTLIPKLQTFFLNIEQDITNFLQQNPEAMDWITSNTDLESIDWAGLVQNTITMAGNSVSAILGSAFSAIGSVTSTIMDLVIAIVFALYCLFQKETLARQGKKLLYAFLPESACDYIVRIMRLSNVTFSSFLSGQCVEVFILGCMFAVTMAILRMPYIPLVSVLVAVTAFIPIVGAWIGCVLGAFLMLVNDPMQAVWFVAMFLVLQQIENNLIYPRVVGTSIGLSGMWVLVAVTVGGELMGVAGMFLMIPFSSVLFSLLREYTQKRIIAKQIDPEKLIEQPPEIISKFKERRQKSKVKSKFQFFKKNSQKESKEN